MRDHEAVAGSAHLARVLALACLRIIALVVAVALYLAAASLMALVVVRVAGDLFDGINPFAEPALRPPLGMARLAQRELAVDILRQGFLAALVVLTAMWREPSAWRRRLALDRAEPNGMRARHLLLILLFWPVLHIVWVTGTADAFGASFAQGVQLSPALSRTAITAWLVYVVMLAPAAEELLMRGELFASARRFLPPAVAVVVTAVLFALAHASAWGLARPVSLMPLALMLGWLRWRTGRLWPCIALHGWSNLALIAYVLWPAHA
ncbi:CPBP family intramembrane glutamic endopeptidase [Methylobacterium nigriterrae]|uniref:CPBP family intramembrane glutamic endopeptidase n=1 Tax=Methylobacterium nigriterrae TaxID=3127512 RepID=UPI0030132549